MRASLAEIVEQRRIEDSAEGLTRGLHRHFMQTKLSDSRRKVHILIVRDGLRDGQISRIKRIVSDLQAVTQGPDRPLRVTDLRRRQVHIPKASLNAVAVIAFKGSEQVAQRIEDVGAGSAEDTVSRDQDLHRLIFADGDRLSFAVALVGHRITGRNRERCHIGFGSGEDCLACHLGVAQLNKLALNLANLFGDRAPAGRRGRIARGRRRRAIPRR